jgi:hypothetical protein
MTSRIESVPENAKAQRREDAKPTQPPGKRRATPPPTLAEAQRRREGNTDLPGMARYPAVGRPDIAVRGNRLESGLSRRFPDTATCALEERRPRHFSFSEKTGNDPTPLPQLKEEKGRTDVPRARRPVSIPAATDACIRSRRDSHRRQAIRSPVVLPSRSGTAPQIQYSHLCVLAPLRLCVHFQVGTHLCASASLRLFGWPRVLRELFVSLCLHGCDVGGCILTGALIFAQILRLGPRRPSLRMTFR